MIDAGTALRHEGKLDQHARLLHQRMRPGMDLAERAGRVPHAPGKPMTLPGRRLEFEIGRLVRHASPPALTLVQWRHLRQSPGDVNSKFAAADMRPRRLTEQIGQLDK